MLPQKLRDIRIVCRIMREGAICADLDNLPFGLFVGWMPEAVFIGIHRAITKQAVKIPLPVMAREILTVFVAKIFG